jgi:hypothetical protein
LEERDYGPRERMITGEKGATMVGEVDRREVVDRHETADAVKPFCLELRGMLRRVIFDRERAYAALK